jgi:hypothetical protein
MSFPLGYVSIISLSHFWPGVQKTHTSLLPLPRSAEHSSLHITYLISRLRVHASCALPIKLTRSTQYVSTIKPSISFKRRPNGSSLQAYRDGHFSSKRAAANAYDIAESSFRHRAQGHPTRHDSTPTNRKLTDTEESILIQWILSMEERGLLPTAYTTRHIANLLLQKQTDTDEGKSPVVGQR